MDDFLKEWTGGRFGKTRMAFVVANNLFCLANSFPTVVPQVHVILKKSVISFSKFCTIDCMLQGTRRGQNRSHTVFKSNALLTGLHVRCIHNKHHFWNAIVFCTKSKSKQNGILVLKGISCNSMEYRTNIRCLFSIKDDFISALWAEKYLGWLWNNRICNASHCCGRILQISALIFSASAALTILLFLLSTGLVQVIH